MSFTVAVSCWPVPRSTAGVRIWIEVGVEEMIVASFGVLPAPKSKKTWSGVWKFFPVMVTTSPPWGRPKFGEMPVIDGVVSGGCGVTGIAENVTVAVFLTFATIADTVAGPTTAGASVGVAPPFVVVRMIVCAFPSEKVPRVVSNSTAVPLGTRLPVASVTVAVITELEFTCGVAFDTLSTMFAEVGGVVPPLVEVGGVVVVVGAVGDSPL